MPASDESATVVAALAPYQPRMPTTIPRMVLDTCWVRPDAKAVADGATSVSYSDLRTEITRLANSLLGLGVEAGDTIALWLPNYREWVVANLAIMAVGAICMPVNIRLKADEVRFQLDQSQATVLFTTSRFMTNDFGAILADLGVRGRPDAAGAARRRDAVLPSLRHIIAVRAEVPWALSYDLLVSQASAEISTELARRLAQAEPTDPATVFWTSGSTGTPKAAETTHEILGNIADYSEILGYSATDSCLVSTPLFYTTANYWVMLTALMCGGCIVLTQSFDAQEIWRAVARERVTVMIGTPNAFIGYLDDEAFDPRFMRSVRLVWLGGATVPPGLVTRLHKLQEDPVSGRGGAVVQVYGMTETGGITTMTAVTDTDEQTAMSVGFPLPGFELRLVSPDTGLEAGPDMPGELWLRGPYILRRYRNISDEQARATFYQGWFRTGDLLRRGRDGRYTFVGRIKDVIKVGGENVSAREVELLLYRHPGVREAAVVGIPDPRRGEAVVAFVSSAGAVTPAELVEFCQVRAARFKVPADVVVTLDLPKTPSGKIKKRELREAYLARRKTPSRRPDPITDS